MKIEGFYSTFRRCNDLNTIVGEEIVRSDGGFANARLAFKCEKDAFDPTDPNASEGIVEIWELRKVASYKLTVKHKLIVEKL